MCTWKISNNRGGSKLWFHLTFCALRLCVMRLWSPLSAQKGVIIKINLSPWYVSDTKGAAQKAIWWQWRGGTRSGDETEGRGCGSLSLLVLQSLCSLLNRNNNSTNVFTIFGQMLNRVWPITETEFLPFVVCLVFSKNKIACSCQKRIAVFCRVPDVSVQFGHRKPCACFASANKWHHGEENPVFLCILFLLQKLFKARIVCISCSTFCFWVMSRIRIQMLRDIWWPSGRTSPICTDEQQEPRGIRGTARSFRTLMQPTFFKLN